MQTTKREFLKTAALAPALATPAILTAAGPAGAAAHKGARDAQVPGFYRYRVGDIRVTALLDGYMPLPDQFVFGFDEAAARASTEAAYRRFTPGYTSIPVNGYVIDTGDRLILVDAGGPSFALETLGGLTGNLKAAGFAPADIDTVLFTHFHPDHVGALLTQEGGRAFANATLVCSETEWAVAHDDNIRNAAPEEFRGFIDLVRNFVAPYAEGRETFGGEKELFTGITSVPLPGHTPGHTGYAIHSGGESLLIWGDIIHASTLQFANPDWGVVFDADPGQAAATRRMMLDRASADRMAVAGMHIDYPGIAYVERAGDAYRHVMAPWMPE